MKKQKEKLAGLSHLKKVTLIRDKESYLTNLCNARFFHARVNMLIDQLDAYDKVKKDKMGIIETVDGVMKSKDYLTWEMLMAKLRARRSYMDAFFGKQELLKQGMTVKDISNLEKDYFEGTIRRDSYDDSMDKRKESAGFV